MLPARSGIVSCKTHYRPVKAKEISMKSIVGTGLAASALLLGAALTLSGQTAPGSQASAAQMASGQMDSMEHHEHKPSAPSTSLLVTAGGKSTTFTLADLQAMPQRTLTVHNGHNKVDEQYTGVGVSDLLAKFGFSVDGDAAKKVYHSYLRAEGTDKYFVLYSASELEPGLRDGDALVALTVDGKPLAEDGKFKMVISGEKKPARWVRNLSSITVVTIQ